MKTEMEQARVGKGFGLGLGIAAGLVVVGFVVGGFRRNGPTMAAGHQVHRLPGGITVSGGIMGIRAATMGADVTKRPGDQLTIDVRIGTVTRDFEGNLIAWPFLVEGRLFSAADTNTNFGKACDSGPICAYTFRTSAAHELRLNMTLPTSLPAGNYKIHVQLSAKGSSAEGAVTDEVVFIAAKIATDIITVGASSGAAVPAGTIGNIVLSQRIRQGRP